MRIASRNSGFTSINRQPKATFTILRILIVLLVSPAFRVGGTHADEATAKPNIVYFLVDDMGFADADFSGSTDIKTPNIDRLAKSGTVLTDCYAQLVCSPTRAAQLTGRYATHTGAYGLYGPLVKHGFSLKERLLPEALHEANYTTAISGKWHLGHEPENAPTQRGLDYQYGCWDGGPNYNTHISHKKLDWYRQDHATWPGKTPAGVQIAEPMHVIDWYPTLLKLGGLPVTQQLPLDGRDVWPMLTEGAISPHDARLLAGRDPNVAAIRKGDWKLLVNPETKYTAEDRNSTASSEPVVTPDGARLELYNLADDISETHDLATQHPEKVKELHTRYVELMRDAVPLAKTSRKKRELNQHAQSNHQTTSTQHPRHLSRDVLLARDCW